ncbi:serine hydrolase domain-containing protein [Devosia nitrariae]|uniref:Serine hydrolase n=1 Tax=Devosia nitrariae TaxID=2071872 RepID=A0ABQ5W663_9HYPH|nr:serine hydrolase [Devosia nitrariae]GLQ55550.1 serine hydrolase [Devosia nitrariae]
MNTHTVFVSLRSWTFVLLATIAQPLLASGSAQGSDWQTATPSDMNFAADLPDQLDTALGGDFYDGVHSVVLARGGKLVYERYLSGDDEIFGLTKEGVVFSPERLHDIRSITKSVVGLLYGIALKDGLVPQLDTPLFRAFPEYPDLPRHPRRREILVSHALSMTMGLEWDEMSQPYGEFSNSENAMYRVSDSIRFALDRPISVTAGTVWTYSGGATALLAEIIRRGTAGDLIEFAEEELFRPLGIERFEWITDYNGLPYAAAGLRLRPRDTAKLGQLVLQSGRWNGRQLVPAEWIAISTVSHAEAVDGCSYGYQWWLCQTQGGLKVIEGSGWGGQNLLIVPDLDLVLVVNAGFYGDSEAWMRAYGLLEDVIIPSIRAD